MAIKLLKMALVLLGIDDTEVLIPVGFCIGQTYLQLNMCILHMAMCTK